MRARKIFMLQLRQYSDYLSIADKEQENFAAHGAQQNISKIQRRDRNILQM